jgi:hypothetical protein
MTSNTVTMRVGRLMEIVVREGFRTLDDVETQRLLITEAMAGVPEGQPIVIAADWRACQTIAQPVAAALGPMIGSFNARIERSGILGSPNAPLTVLQFFRMASETRHPKRRVFDDRDSMIDWLSDCLSPAERHRLGQFLAG